jgi:hypothetical protein
MSIYHIKEVVSQQDIKAFHLLPFKIYKEDPNWIPHIKQEVEGVFDKKTFLTYIFLL